jgi:integrase
VLEFGEWLNRREKNQHRKNRQCSKMGKWPRAGALRRPLRGDLERPRTSPLPPRRTSNASRRSREYLTPDEVEKLLQASSKVGRHGLRDQTLILLAYRHGLRVSELVALRWEQIDMKAGLVHVARLKNGLPSNHPLRGPCASSGASIRSRPTCSSPSAADR